jgi:hypothetical protein
MIALAAGEAPVTTQVFSDSGKHWLAVILPPKALGGTFDLQPWIDDDNKGAKNVALERSGSNLLITLDHKLFSKYITDAGAKPFLFPLIGPTGDSFTRAFPMENIAGEDHDHPHQRSFWFTHGKVNEVDFWSEQGVHGTIKETARKTVLSGPVIGRLRTTDDWLAPDGRKVLEDERVLTFYSNATARIVDFEVTLKSSTGAVIFGDTKEGMFGIRVASSMDVDKKRGGRITNALGLTDAQAWGQASPWVDYTGPVGGEIVGIAILNHPRSFRYPTTWHVRTYGLFAANPFGWHDFGKEMPGDYTLPAGQELWFSYRLILHQFETSKADIASQFAAYAEPPAIQFSRR